MLNLINILTLSTALTLQPLTDTITITTNGNTITSKSTLKKESEEFAFIFYEYKKDNTSSYINFSNYNQENDSITNLAEINKFAIGYITTQKTNYNLYKYEKFNKTEELKKCTIFSDTITENKGNSTYTLEIKIRSTTFMEELLTALTTAVQSAVSIFVEGFGGLTQIFYNGTEITFIGGILVVGLAVMFLMMFLRWIVSFVKGI